MVETETFKVVLKIERRPDGGLRVWSDDVPGLVLSHSDPDKVLADIKPALEVILSETFGYQVEVSPLRRFPVRDAAKRRPLSRGGGSPLSRSLGLRRKTLEFAAHACG